MHAFACLDGVVCACVEDYAPCCIAVSVLFAAAAKTGELNPSVVGVAFLSIDTKGDSKVQSLFLSSDTQGYAGIYI